MFRRFLLCGLFLLAPSATMAADVPDSADKVSPLLIGSSVADVTLHTPEGEAVSLAGLLDQKRTILVFYRGGW